MLGAADCAVDAEGDADSAGGIEGEADSIGATEGDTVSAGGREGEGSWLGARETGRLTQAERQKHRARKTAIIFFIIATFPILKENSLHSIPDTMLFINRRFALITIS